MSQETEFQGENQEQGLALSGHFLCDQAVGEGKDAKDLPQSWIGLQAVKPHWIPAREKWELMDRAIGTQNFPASGFQKAPGLKKELDAVKWLVGNAIRMPKFCIKLVKTHEIQIIGSCQIERTAGPSDTMELLKTLKRQGQMLNGFARDHDIEARIRER